jgi:hypothetical protein
MKITKIIAAFMVAGLIGIAGCDSAVEEPAGGPDPTVEGGEAEGMMEGMPDGDPGEETEEPAGEPAEEPAEEAPADE